MKSKKSKLGSCNCIYNSDSLYDSNATAICMDDPYIIKDTGRVNLYSVKDISGKTVILKLCGSVLQRFHLQKCI